MNAPLAVPAPTLGFDPVAGTCAPLEKPIVVAFGPVKFDDGGVVTTAELRAANALLVRRSAASAPDEVWDAAARAWRAVASVDLATVKGLPLAPSGAGDPWTATLVATGQTDANAAPFVTPASAGFPQYRLRGAFNARRGDGTGALDASGVGDETPPFTFASSIAQTRLALEQTPDAATATRVRIMLKDGAAQTVGMLEIDATSADTLTLASFDASGATRAAIAIQSDGAIRLTPATGGRVIIVGDLQVGHVNYLPIDDTVPRDLKAVP